MASTKFYNILFFFLTLFIFVSLHIFWFVFGIIEGLASLRFTIFLFCSFVVFNSYIFHFGAWIIDGHYGIFCVLGGNSRIVSLPFVTQIYYLVFLLNHWRFNHFFGIYNTWAYRWYQPNGCAPILCSVFVIFRSLFSSYAIPLCLLICDGYLDSLLLKILE